MNNSLFEFILILQLVRSIFANMCLFYGWEGLLRTSVKSHVAFILLIVAFRIDHL